MWFSDSWLWFFPDRRVDFPIGDSSPSSGLIMNVDALLKAFYLKSDDPHDHEGYANFFTPDATLVMGLKTFKGYQGACSKVI
jgi:hypothetical protein